MDLLSNIKNVGSYLTTPLSRTPCNELGAGLALGISALGSLIGGGLSSMGSAQANRRGVKLAREQMKWQEEQTEKQRAWNEDIYNRYSTPSALAAQYRAAGLNPQLQNVQAGSVMSSDAPQGVQMPEQQNEFSGLGSSVSQAATDSVAAYNSTQMANANKSLADSNKNLNDANAQLALAQKELTANQSEQARQNVEKMKLDLQLMRDTYDMQIKSLYYDNLLKQWNASDSEADYRLKMFDLYNVKPAQVDSLQKQSLASLGSYFRDVSQGKYTLKQAQYYLKELSIRQYDAISNRINANANDRNSKALSYLNTQLGREKEQYNDWLTSDTKGYYRDSDGTIRFGSHKRSQFLYQQIYDMNKATFTNLLQQPSALRSLIQLQGKQGEMYDAIKWRNYVGAGTMFGDWSLDSYNNVFGEDNAANEHGSFTEETTYDYDSKGNKHKRRSRVTQSNGGSNTSRSSRRRSRRRR